jgi:hypothetical protein
MRKEVAYGKIAIPFIWAGCVGAISFLEAWLKFTAPGVTLTTGLSIGKVVFAALNKVELTFAVLLALPWLFKRKIDWGTEVFYLVALAILILQSVWLLPLLSSHIDIYLAGKLPPPSNAHVNFVVLEAVKLISLLLYGFKLLATWKL